jgi:ABC-type multidrug transport system fused ATPase/permease subunit
MLRSYYTSFADATELVEILDQPHEIKDARGAKALRVTRGELVFDQVKFSYGAGSVLNDFDLKIQPGEKIALVGTSGAGKSTIVKLLFRFYDLTSGAITVDGQNIKNVTQDSLRGSIALVPQEPILFHRSLFENIRYGKPDATEKDVMKAAKLAHCHEFIEKLPQGYETQVGERGVKLSGGERQRVAIARAILKNAPILVLDEATSSLDSESEGLIQDALRSLMRGKTTIVIAHRLSTIMSMDRIVIMDQGKVADTGTHAELLQKTGIYQKLWNLQVGGFFQE